MDSDSVDSALVQGADALGGGGIGRALPAASRGLSRPGGRFGPVRDVFGVTPHGGGRRVNQKPRKSGFTWLKAALAWLGTEALLCKATT